MGEASVTVIIGVVGDSVVPRHFNIVSNTALVAQEIPRKQWGREIHVIVVVGY